MNITPLFSRLAPIAAIIVSSSAFSAEVMSMRPLFNGKNLSGWKGDGYIIEDGTIVCTPEGRNLVTEETFSNYVLDFQFKLDPGANNGLGIHYSGDGNGAYTGMEIQIFDAAYPENDKLKDHQFHGSLYTLAPTKKGALKPAGEWNQERVTVMDSTVKVELNGQIILRANLNDLSASHPDHQGVKRRAGHIAWLGHGDRVAFRNIHIAELPPVANENGIKAAGFTKIFTGGSLDGWKHKPETHNWKGRLGILKHNGKTGPINNLWSEKSYKNFTLVFDWRWSGRGPMKSQPIIMSDGSNNGTHKIEEFNSGIYLRGNTKSPVNLWNWNVGSGEVYGYRTDPAMSAEVKAGVTPKTKADRPLGEWNRMMITLKGDRLSVQLNGKQVIDNAQLPDIPKSGPIGLQHHGSAIDFSNIWIKEL